MDVSFPTSIYSRNSAQLPEGEDPPIEQSPKFQILRVGQGLIISSILQVKNSLSTRPPCDIVTDRLGDFKGGLFNVNQIRLYFLLVRKYI